MAGEIKLNNVSIATENAGTVTINNATLGNSMVLGTNASPIANNLVFANGNGIDFSAAAGSASGSSSALLDDYEEGTYSPEYKTNGVSLSGVTYDVQVGYYIKTGGFVYVSIQLRYDVTGTFSASSGNLTVTLPFTCGPLGRGGGFRTVESAWVTSAPDSGYVVSGTDAIQLMKGNTTLTDSNVYTSGTNRNFLNLNVILHTS